MSKILNMFCFTKAISLLTVFSNKVFASIESLRTSRSDCLGVTFLSGTLQKTFHKQTNTYSRADVGLIARCFCCSSRGNLQMSSITSKSKGLSTNYHIKKEMQDSSVKLMSITLSSFAILECNCFTSQCKYRWGHSDGDPWYPVLTTPLITEIQ